MRATAARGGAFGARVGAANGWTPGRARSENFRPVRDRRARGCCSGSPWRSGRSSPARGWRAWRSRREALVRHPLERPGRPGVEPAA